MIVFYKYLFDQKVFCNSNTLFLLIIVFAIATYAKCVVSFIVLDHSTEFLSFL